jgi:amino acid adenylation domain-containing protein
MGDRSLLHQFLDHSATRWPERIAIEEPDHGSITYRELAGLADRMRDRLREMGLGPGDRVAIGMRKSIDAVAAIFGVLKAGAAYVPLDPGAPAARNDYILKDCSVKAVVGERNVATPLAVERDRCEAAPDDLAYILYTSGSTGRPKGVMLSHRNATSFIDWCSATFHPDESDRFSSHAPFHFDLSILDIFVSIKHGATLVLIGEEAAKEPGRLAPLISERRITVWYSTPSILSLLVHYGKLPRHDYSSLRLVLFAGEVFPVKHLRALKEMVPAPRYFNLYGPTETNVCTYYEIPAEIPADRAEPFPIGRACSHCRLMVVNGEEREVAAGAEGELCVGGPGVMQGYWNLPEQTEQVFLLDRSGQRWYKTGDIVVKGVDGNHLFVGRRDRMVKRRGYRIELGEIEAALYLNPAVQEAAAVALPDEDQGVRIKAFLTCREGKRPSLIELKRFCVEHLPSYMAPDLFSFQDVFPRTSTNKIDYQRLKDLD